MSGHNFFELGLLF